MVGLGHMLFVLERVHYQLPITNYTPESLSHNSGMTENVGIGMSVLCFCTQFAKINGLQTSDNYSRMQPLLPQNHAREVCGSHSYGQSHSRNKRSSRRKIFACT